MDRNNQDICSYNNKTWNLRFFRMWVWEYKTQWSKEYMVPTGDNSWVEKQIASCQ